MSSSRPAMARPHDPSRLDWATLRSWTSRLLVAAGLEVAPAEVTVDNLEYAERRGFVSHGFLRLPTYVERLRAGGINGRPNLGIVNDRTALAVVDADASIGAHSAVICTDLAIEKASMSGVGVVIARNANHFGAAGYYTDRMASSGFLGIAVCNTDAVMCAPFGGRAVLGTNPISIGVPEFGSVGPHLDMATSQAAHGKLIAARDRGDEIPDGWAVDPIGNPTNDPALGLAGALLPSGGPKGFALAFMVDCLVAIGGARTSNDVSALYGDPAAPQELGHAFIAISVDSAQTAAEYASRVDALSAAVHESVTPGSSSPPMVPGEPEKQQLARPSDLVVSEPTRRALEELSVELGVPIPD